MKGQLMRVQTLTRFAFLTPILIVAILAAGCANRAATAPVPGQLNNYDAFAYRVLADAQAALNAFRADVTSGKVAETSTIKTYFNQASSDYNIAEAAYTAWHAAGGNGSTTALAAQISKVETDIATLAGGAQ
jgi:hypothetical protein